MLPLHLLVLIHALQHVNFANGQARWCGKVYYDREGKISAPMDTPLPSDLIPPSNSASFHAQPRKSAYAIHEKGTMLVQITQPSLDMEKHVWMTCHVQDTVLADKRHAKTVVAPVEIAVHQQRPTEVDMTLIHSREQSFGAHGESDWTYAVECDFSTQSTFLHLLATTTSQVTVLSSSPKVLVDRKHRSLVVNGQSLYSYGGMSSYEWLVRDTETVLRREFLPRGLNTLHIVPGGPVHDPSPWKRIFAAASRVGVWVTFNMRHSYRNLTQVRQEVGFFKDEPALLNWYTADEPDGWVEDVQDVKAAYDLIHSLDPHHPVSLVLNCHRFRIADYARFSDIVYTDPYPIGAKWCDETVNASFGCCGCDECGLWKPEPGTGVLDVAKRFDHYRSVYSRHAQPGPVDPHFLPLFGCLQAFGGGEWWARVPSNEELRIMFYLALIHGATGLSWWVSPGPDAVEMMLGIIGLEFSKFAKHTLGMQRLLDDEMTVSVQSVHGAAWQGYVEHADNILLVLGNTGPSTSFKVHFKLPIRDKVQIIIGKQSGAVRHGVYEDVLHTYETKVLIFSSQTSKIVAPLVMQTS